MVGQSARRLADVSWLLGSSHRGKFETMELQLGRCGRSEAVVGRNRTAICGRRAVYCRHLLNANVTTAGMCGL